MKALAAAALGALVLCGTALADQWQVHRTAAGDRQAKAVVLTRADLGGAAGWTGGSIKPDLTSGLTCKSYDPKQSDLIVVGAAETKWDQAAGIEIDDQATVLKTARMVSLDWQRTVLDPRVAPCLRAMLSKEIGAGGKLASFGRVAFPSVAPLSRAYRAVISVTSGGTKVDVDADIVLIGKKNTEISLMVVVPSAARAQMHGAEVRLARILASRVS